MMSDGRKQVDDPGQESFNLLFTVIQATKDAMIAITEEGLIAIFNPAAEQMFGYSHEEMLGQPLDRLMPEEFRERHGEYVKSYFATGEPRRALDRVIELPGLRSDGTVFPMEISLSAGRYGGEQPKQFVIGIARDITERRRAEEEQHAQLERVRNQQAAIVQLATLGAAAAGDFEAAARSITEVASAAMDVERLSVWLLSEDGQRLCCTDLFERSNGAHSAGMTLDTKDYPRYFAALRAARGINSADARTDPRTSEFTDGYLVPLSISSMLDAPIRVRGELAGVICSEHVGPCRTWQTDEVAFAGEVADQAAQVLMNRERTRAEEDRARLENQIREARKFESLGVLAAGMARDFDELMGGVLDAAGALKRGLPAESPAMADIQRIEKAARQAGDVTRQLLAYAGEGDFVVAPVDLSALVAEMAHLLETSVPQNVVLKQELVERLPAVQADRTQTRQLISSLVANASDAIGADGGVVTVSTGVMEADRHYLVRTHLGGNLPAGHYAYVEVADTGRGMDEETRARVFDPFFTTKSAGRGLGLAAVLGIVRGHGGAILVDSTPGRGSTFRVLFPLAR